jgi:nitroimidazol reductase NimA-like FMN-containing flavoprotein (pyridoxamine 5'-phosphate oxidase superfamily)
MSSTSHRTRVRRLPERAAYDRKTVHAILDEGLICHVGFVLEGQPFVIPTIHGRDGEKLYLHGSAASRMLRSIREGIPVCVTVTIVDGLVLARSAFNHSMNYRSVVALGTAKELKGERERLHALKVISDHVLPGRWEDARRPTKKELAQTLVLELELKECSAKVRTGPPHDDDEDYALKVWAGELPLKLEAGSPAPDSRLAPGVELPAYLGKLKRF